ncbi:hypothetical protein M885DRAFT_613235 [Pelagophyceae sp. CCMP2097]|nr:hypothetical protein M885DRAFT_613235 [Pelagophyceae sp. CCMP2097]
MASKLPPLEPRAGFLPCTGESDWAHLGSALIPVMRSGALVWKQPDAVAHAFVLSQLELRDIDVAALGGRLRPMTPSQAPDSVLRECNIKEGFGHFDHCHDDRDGDGGATAGAADGRSIDALAKHQLHLDARRPRLLEIAPIATALPPVSVAGEPQPASTRRRASRRNRKRRKPVAYLVGTGSRVVCV